MRWDQDVKVIEMIPTQKITNATVSAATAGSGGQGAKGIVDTRGYTFARIEVRDGAGNSKITKFHLGFQSGAATLMASSTLFSGRTSGIVLSAKTASQSLYVINVNLNAVTNRKRYLNCKLTHSTTSRPASVSCRLFNAEQFPPASDGATTTTNFGF